MGNVLVIGSSNTDMVIRVEEPPRPGQTVSGDDFRIFAGGKGANQATAARRAGGAVQFLAAVGGDDFGTSAIASLASEGIDTTGVKIVADAASGVAMIFVSASGENCIAVAPGANALLSPPDLQKQQHAFTHADIVLIQLETPLATVEAAIQMAGVRGLPVILNPAPATALPDTVFDGLYCITPNESEAELLTGIPVTDHASAIAAADVLLGRGVQHVIVTLGADGALLHHAGGTHHQSAEAVAVVDTTAAGDTFNGVLATMIADGASLKAAMKTAVSAATLAVQTAGAIASIPHLETALDQ